MERLIMMLSFVALMACGKAEHKTKEEKQTTFYRLKVVDKDGSFIYSPVIRVDK